MFQVKAVPDRQKIRTIAPKSRRGERTWKDGLQELADGHRFPIEGVVHEDGCRAKAATNEALVICIRSGLDESVE